MTTPGRQTTYEWLANRTERPFRRPAYPAASPGWRWHPVRAWFWPTFRSRIGLERGVHPNEAIRNPGAPLPLTLLPHFGIQSSIHPIVDTPRPGKTVPRGRRRDRPQGKEPGSKAEGFYTWSSDTTCEGNPPMAGHNSGEPTIGLRGRLFKAQC